MSPEATIAETAEIWDPEVELDAAEAPALEINRPNASDGTTSWATPSCWA
jgi:hypothetical protein